MNDDKDEEAQMPLIEYFGIIFDFYFDALLKGNSSNQFPLILAILNKIDESYDVFSPLSKRHRYLVRIAMKKIKKRYKGKKFEDFPGRVPMPKALYKLRDSHKDETSVHISGTSPRRSDKKRKRTKQNERSEDNQSLLFTSDN